MHATGKPVVFVNCSGSAIAMPWEAKNLPAIVQAWYPGEQGGRAVADVLFGDANPAGRLPVTFYRSTADLPAFEDYSMSNRTYRYFNGKPVFAFGHGLSYTKFDYTAAALDKSKYTAGDTVKISFPLKNSGARDGDEVAQVYFRHVNSAVPQPKLALCGFARIHLAQGQGGAHHDGHSGGTVSLLGHEPAKIRRRAGRLRTARRRGLRRHPLARAAENCRAKLK